MILKQEVIESPKERLMVSEEMRMVYINISLCDGDLRISEKATSFMKSINEPAKACFQSKVQVRKVKFLLSIFAN